MSRISQDPHLADSPPAACLDPGASARHQPQRPPARQRAGDPLCSPPSLLAPSSAGFWGAAEGQKRWEGMEKKRATDCRGREEEGEERGTSPGACILRMLIITFLPRVPTLSSLPQPLLEEGPVLSVWQGDFESLLLPQVGKNRINSGAAGRGNALAQQAKNRENTSPPRPSDKSYKAGCMCVCELLIHTHPKFALYFPSCITTYSPRCPRGLGYSKDIANDPTELFTCSSPAVHLSKV